MAKSQPPRQEHRMVEYESQDAYDRDRSTEDGDVADATEDDPDGLPTISVERRRELKKAAREAIEERLKARRKARRLMRGGTL